MAGKKKIIPLAPGVYVEDDVLHVVQKIKDRYPTLNVKYCDPSRFDFLDAPYRITEICKDGIERTVMDVWELDERVLEKLWDMDTSRVDVLAAIDKQNRKAELERNRRFKESKDEAEDIIKSYLKSPKHKWSFKENGKKVTLDDDPKAMTKVEYDDSFNPEN